MALQRNAGTPVTCNSAFIYTSWGKKPTRLPNHPTKPLPDLFFIEPTFHSTWLLARISHQLAAAAPDASALTALRSVGNLVRKAG